MIYLISTIVLGGLIYIGIYSVLAIDNLFQYFGKESFEWKNN
jgi:hypothetical protein